jgi:hypothetical protein
MLPPGIEFELRLAQGAQWEQAVSDWLRKPGHGISVLELFKYRHNGQPPVFISIGDRIITPDMQVIGGGSSIYLEVKSKRRFAKNPYTMKSMTGIDLHHWKDYIRVQQESGIKVLIVFVHEETKEVRADFVDVLDRHPEKDEVPKCRTGRGGMVFWPHDAPQLIGRINEASSERSRIRTATLKIMPWSPSNEKA